MEKDFYQAMPLSAMDIEVITTFSRQSPAELHKLHMSYLEKFILFQRAKALHDKSRYRTAYSERLMHATQCNLMENLHTAHESEAYSVTSSLASGDLSILDNIDNMQIFMSFFGQQISRTRRNKEKIFQHLDTAMRSNVEFVASMRNSWWFLSYVLGMSIGASLYCTRNQNTHTLLINRTSTPFITSDQPIFNIHPDEAHDGTTPPERADFFYPLSPTAAYVISDSNQFPPGKTEIDHARVEALNIMTAQRADIYLFSSCKKTLLENIKYMQ